MKEIEMTAIAMAPVNTKKSKQGIFHGKVEGEPCRIVINLGSDQFRLIEAEIELPCA